MRLNSLPSKEMPRERLLSVGADALSLPELLAVLLRTGSRGRDVLELAADILREFRDIKGLFRATGEEMLQIPGLGEAKVCVLLAAMELGKRIGMERAAPPGARGWERVLSEAAVDLASEEREYILSLYVRRNGTVIARDRISYGGPDGAFLDIKYLLRRAVRLDCSGLVILHNHPDGSLEASSEDRSLTDFLFRKARILDIDLLGHFVTANGKYRAMPLPGEA